MARSHGRPNVPMCIGLLILLLAMTLPAGAQGSVTATFNSLESGRGKLTTAYVSVQDENGLPIRDLVPANFAIVEDGHTSFPPDTVTVQVNENARLAVALVADLSGNMQGQALTDTKSAAQKLLETLLDQPNDPDRAAFFGISGSVDVNDLTVHEDKQEIGFTYDRNKVLNLINSLDVPGTTATPLYDALMRVVKITANQAKPRAVIVITDGFDNVSKFSADDPINEANRNNIPIFPVGYSKGAINDTYLTRLATRTGGAYTRAPDAGQFSAIFEDTLSRLKQQYVLTYETRLAKDSAPHSVMIQVDCPKGSTSAQKVLRFTDLPTAAPSQVPQAAPAPAAAIPVANVQGQAAPTAPPAPTATPVAKTMIENATNFVTDPKNLPVLIGVVAGLIVILAVALFLLLRKRQPAAEPQYDDGFATGGVAAEPPTMQSRPALPDTTAAPGSGTVVAYPPTTAPGGGFGQAPSFPPQAMGSPAGQPASFGPPSPAAGGQTVILPRSKPQPPVLGLLVDKKQPQQRFDVVASTDIGRGATNNVVLQSATVSRQHAKIRQEKDEFLVHDLGSANGTFVNDRRVTEPAPLKDGDVVRFGEVEFLFKRLC